MKAAIIYSGKGGVGKTTTTANVARILCKQHKVFVLDMDINTPSMNTEFHGEHPEENLWIHSTGNMFDKFIYLERSMIEHYINSALKKIQQISPDVILIDTPPSITETHINILKKINVSVVIFVSQPTTLSQADVLRTSSFFKDRCDPCVAYMVENMCSPDTLSQRPFDYGIEVVARIPLMQNFEAQKLIKECEDSYTYIAQKILSGTDVQQATHFSRPPYDETFDLKDVYRNNQHCFIAVIMRDGEDTEKEMLIGKQPRFLSIRTWRDLQSYLIDRFEDGPRMDKRISECDTDRLKRMVAPFYETNNAYFMVTNAPACETHLITGEIGVATLMTDAKGFYGIPRLKYHTSQGDVILFANEVMPIAYNDIQSFIADGYTILTDGRYLPPKETVQECYDLYGERVGISSNWEQYYDMWNNNNTQDNE